MAELASIFGLPNKEFVRSSKQARAEDLSAKQLAMAVTNIAPCVCSQDVMEIGGDAASKLNLCYVTGLCQLETFDFVESCTGPTGGDTCFRPCLFLL